MWYTECGLTLVFLIAFICLWKKIKLLIAILKSAARFCMEVPSSICVPILYFFVSLVYVVWVIGTFGYLYTAGTLDKTN